MPAAAVIPAPPVYIYAVAVKKLVVGSSCQGPVHLCGVHWLPTLNRQFSVGALHRVSSVAGMFTLKKLECSKQAFRLNIRAWNNRIGPWLYFVGFRRTRK